MLGEVFLKVLIIEFDRKDYIHLLVKTTEEVDWGLMVDPEEDLLYQYLRRLGYRTIDIVASTRFEGEWVM